MSKKLRLQVQGAVPAKPEVGNSWRRAWGGDCKKLEMGRDEFGWAGRLMIPKGFKEGNDLVPFTCLKKHLSCWVENYLGLRNKNQISMFLSVLR